MEPQSGFLSSPRRETHLSPAWALALPARTGLSSRMVLSVTLCTAAESVSAVWLRLVASRSSTKRAMGPLELRRLREAAAAEALAGGWEAAAWLVDAWEPCMVAHVHVLHPHGHAWGPFLLLLAPSLRAWLFQFAAHREEPRQGSFLHSIWQWLVREVSSLRASAATAGRISGCS